MRMTSPTGTEATAPNPGLKMLAILMVAAIIGVAFNNMNPLGIRPHTDSEPGAAITGGNVYQNETARISIGSAAAPAAAQPAGLYENTTIRATLDSSFPTLPPIAYDGTITWLETKKLVAEGGVVLVDARASAYYQTEHIPGAVSLPPGESTEADFTAFAARYPKNTPLVVYCGSLSCPLSKRLIAVLTDKLGYTNVRDMAGGFVEYRETEAALSKGGGQ
jgi:rhodanese-related sulfurtransferase